jgi:8-oxo-dGTP pyrophosphatase MutT (NUDIX family)
MIGSFFVQAGWQLGPVTYSAKPDDIITRIWLRQWPTPIRTWVFPAGARVE